MRISAGSLSGRSLKTITAPGYRPATARVREAIFSMLQSRGLVLSGSRVLDLFAGSGSLGFEALSLGAEHLCLVENNPKAVKCLQENIEKLEVRDRCQVVAEDVAKFCRAKVWQQYELIFIDPPYGDNVLQKSLSAVVKAGLLSSKGFLVAEIEQHMALDLSKFAELSLEVDRSYGQTRILIWTNQERI